ncbi:MAG: phosphatase PAP2 family protein [Bacteroidia bacterium]|nr:phosphatase PAP2 family protein [Bacteroidia bacterium]MBT8276488.1 phosphatase PAP2 family protein [Bacteroidia bacterium]NNF32037.1 phosphatase PAP2 family protein [Flavobacteriaceae bacterium]NNK53443.1 phosphatase PAP2 family protein [Flavobacteriaceae bacterium]NNM09826.1 phosphatase PAP2 family protein [Flavobacteriaceae bacterium]
MIEQLKVWDRELFIWLNGLGVESYDAYWIFITKIESWTPIFILFLAGIIYYYRWKRGLILIGFVLLTFGLTLFLTDFTKEWVGRLRPNNSEQLAGLIRILQKPESFSFFSGHASSSFVVTTFVFLSIRKFNKWILLAYLWPILFVLSRIYVGVHYPSDIIIGAIVGILMAYFFYYISKLILNKIYM